MREHSGENLQKYMREFFVRQRKDLINTPFQRGGTPELLKEPLLAVLVRLNEKAGR